MGTTGSQCLKNMSYCMTVPCSGYVPHDTKSYEQALTAMEKKWTVLEQESKERESQYHELQAKYMVIETKYDIAIKRVIELKAEVKTVTTQIRRVEAEVHESLMGHSELLDDNIIIIQE